METIYLLIRVSLNEEDTILGGYSSKEMAEAARCKYRSENTTINDYHLCIRPLNFDSEPKVELGWDYDLGTGLRKVYNLHWVKWIEPCSEFPDGTTKDLVIGHYSTYELADKADAVFLLALPELRNHDLYMSQALLDLDPVTGKPL